MLTAILQIFFPRHWASFQRTCSCHSKVQVYPHNPHCRVPDGPTDHGEKLHDVPDEYLADALPVAKKIALAVGAENYNVLQNNGRIAHQVRILTPHVWFRVLISPQEVPHVHFHVIPKLNESTTEGLVVGWPIQKIEKDELTKLHEEIKGRL